MSVPDLNLGSVILDSGTTDTYFPRAMAGTFKEIFESMTGVTYDTNGMKLTKEQLDLIPSLVVQLNGVSGSAADGLFDPSDPDAHPGLAGKLDPDHPNDVLVVMTPKHYFQYNAKKDKYKPM